MYVSLKGSPLGVCIGYLVTKTHEKDGINKKWNEWKQFIEKNKIQFHCIIMSKMANYNVKHQDVSQHSLVRLFITLPMIHYKFKTHSACSPKNRKMWVHPFWNGPTKQEHRNLIGFRNSWKEPKILNIPTYIHFTA